MASAPKTIRTLSGNAAPSGAASDNPALPLNPQTLSEAVQQLQNTVNELIARFNAHTHTGVTAGAGTSGAPSAGTTVTGTAQAATNLFTDN